MTITQVEKAEIVVQKNGVKAQKLYDHQEAIVNHITFQPGARLKTHTTPVDVFFYVLEGKALGLRLEMNELQLKPILL